MWLPKAIEYLTEKRNKQRFSCPERKGQMFPLDRSRDSGLLGASR
jgi:hypothetical protein